MKKVKDGYKMTELGEIPDEWSIKQLGDVAEIIMGQSPNGDSYNNLKEGVPLLNGPTEFTNKYPIPKQWTTKPTKLCRDKDILFCVRGSSTGRMNISNGSFCIGRGLASISGKENKANTNFIHQTLLFRINCLLNESAGSTFPNIGRESLIKFPIVIAPIIEQQKISAILSCVDEQIENADNLIEKTKELKKGLMKRLLTKGIGHDRFKETEIGRIPEEWEVRKLGEVFHTVTDYVANGSFASLKENVNYKNEEDYAVLIRLTDYNNNFTGPFVYVDKKAYDFLSKSSLKPGDIIIANVGAYAGFPFRVKEINKPMTLGPNAILVRSKENVEYIYYWLNSELGQQSLKNIISTTAQPKFNKTDFKTLQIPIPNYEEQERIAIILSSIDEQIENYRLKKEKLQELKKGLMQKLLTGKIRVI